MRQANKIAHNSPSHENFNAQAIQNWIRIVPSHPKLDISSKLHASYMASGRMAVDQLPQRVSDDSSKHSFRWTWHRRLDAHPGHTRVTVVSPASQKGSSIGNKNRGPVRLRRTTNGLDV